MFERKNIPMADTDLAIYNFIKDDDKLKYAL